MYNVRVKEQINHNEVLPFNEQRIIVITDIGRDPDDMATLLLGSALMRERIVDIVAVIATLTPAYMRARLAKYTLGALGFFDIPVGVGSDIPSVSLENIHSYEFRGLPEDQKEHPSSEEVLARALEKSEDSSVELLIIAALTDLGKFIKKPDLRNLFLRKVRKVTIMGGVENSENEATLNEKGYLLPDSSANYEFDRESALQVFQFLQLEKIPMTLVSRFAVYNAPISRKTFDKLGETEHPVGLWLSSRVKEGFENLWRRTNMATDDPARALPARCDRRWFMKTFTNDPDGEVERDQSIWEHIKQLTLYDPIALIALCDKYREDFFDPAIVITNGVEHQVIGLSNQQSGVKDGSKLSQFLEEKLISGLSSEQS
jgi:inosine-uridine nucleoside N-ribohydrolase